MHVFNNSHNTLGRKMMTRYKNKFFYAFTFFCLFNLPVSAEEQPCEVNNRACVLDVIEQRAGTIEKQSWKDQTFRELAKTMAFEGDIDSAVRVLNKIENPDTKALTIRGIGMAAAEHPENVGDLKPIFQRLRAEAEKIEHPPSYAIALTYIAMSEAFAGDNDAAWATATSMENEALRHKAYAETAEIQAEQGDFKAAFKSIEFIESKAFRNKAYDIVSRILSDKGQFDAAFEAAQNIDNAYKQTSALQYLLDKQKPREAEK